MWTAEHRAPHRRSAVPAALVAVALLAVPALPSAARASAPVATAATPSPTRPDQVGDIPGYRPPRTLRPHVLVGDGGAVPDIPATVSGAHWTLGRQLSGHVLATFDLPAPGGTRPLLGDWDGDGLSTPATYRAGVWHLYGSLDASDPGTTFSYGAPTDRPVTGDWNGDGVTDIGVVRATAHGLRWLLRLSPSPGPAQVSFTYGVAGDVPVAGDWDGDGRTDAGVVRRGVWYLRGSAAVAPAATRRVFSYGLPGDVPVAGDWDGRGSDGIAVVKPNGVWLLRYAATPGPPSAQLNGGSGVPLRWTPPRPGDGDRCPTATVTTASAAASVLTRVQPPTPADPPQPAGPLHTALLNADRYLLTSYRDGVDAVSGGAAYVDVLAGSPVQEWAVRTPAAAAMALAVSLHGGAYDPAATGVPEPDAAAFAVRLLRSVACQSAAVSLSGWGGDWQSAYWAYLDGLAGWLLWDRLSDTERLYVALMVEREAERLVGYPVPYYAAPDGTVLTPGDSKAEENAWDASVLELAAAMMPGHPHRAAWMHEAVALLVSTTARPADVGSSLPVNGLPLAAWLGGSNVLADGTVVNHDRVHPAYTASVLTIDWSAVATYALGGQAVPEAALRGTADMYRALTTVSFAAPPNLDPGGTMYRPGAADVYFPQGNDWGTSQVANFAAMDEMAAALRLDPDATAQADQYRSVHLQRVLDMQARSADGRSYVAPGEDVYPGREQWVAMNLAYAWLTDRVLSDDPLRVDAGDYSAAG